MNKMTVTNFNIPASRKEAKEQGLKTYKSTSACKRKHLSLRFVSNGHCIKCAEISSQKSRRNIEKLKLQKEVEEQKRKKFTAMLFSKNYYYFIRRKRIKQATPFWSDMEEIQRIYNNCPPNMAVDHIVPIAGEKVCGLHVPCNLQYLSKIENSRKGNRF